MSSYGTDPNLFKKPFLLSLTILSIGIIFAGTIEVLAQTAIPDPPTGLSANPISPTSVKLTWIKPSNNGSSVVTSYKIEYKMIPNDYSILVTTTNSSTSYTHTGAVTGKNYVYRVSAINSAGPSSPSVEAIAKPTSTSGGAATAPNSPSSIIATAVSPTKVTLSWTAPANNGGSQITGYKIERKAGTGSYSILIANTGNATNTSSDTGLTTGTTYYYKISAINSVGISTPSSEASVTPTSTSAPPPQQITVPNSPTGLKASIVSTTQISLSWTAPANTGGAAITGYKIEVKSGSSYSVLAANAGTATSYSHAGLITGTTYTYRVSAINSVGTSNPSNEASARPVSTTTPTGLVATAGSPTMVYLSWTPPTDTFGQQISGYKIEKKLGPDAYVTVISNTGKKDTVYSVTGLTTGTTYTYVVSAVITTGNTGRSNEASATPTSTSNAPAPTSVTTAQTTQPVNKKLTKEEQLAAMKAEIDRKIAEAKSKLPTKNSTELSEKAKQLREDAAKANEKARADAKAAKEKAKQDAAAAEKQKQEEAAKTKLDQSNADAEKAKKEKEAKAKAKAEREKIKQERLAKQKKK